MKNNIAQLYDIFAHNVNTEKYNLRTEMHVSNAIMKINAN